MKEKILKQTAACIVIILAFLISGNSGIPALEKGVDTVLAHMSVSYTSEDIKAMADKGITAAASATGRVETAVSVITGKTVYGEPIDEEYEGEETFVYAVAGGRVTAVGENEEIGRYVRIVHGNQAESLYGNLSSVNVEAPSNVKKGAIIGVYKKTEGKDFYYSLNEKE